MKPNLLLILITAICAFASSPILIRFSHLPAQWIVVGRFVIGIFLLLPLWLHQRRKEKSGKFFSWPRFFAGLLLGGHFILWTLSLRHTAVSSAAVAICGSPIFVLLISRFYLKKTLPRGTVVGILIATAGAVLLFFNDLQTQTHGRSGVLMAFLGSFLYANYFLISERERRETPLMIYVIPVYCVAMLPAGIWILFDGKAAMQHVFAMTTWREVLIVGGLAVFPTVIGHTGFNYLIKRMSATTLSTAGLLEPFLSSTAAVFLLHEHPSALGLIGASMTLCGIFWILRERADSRYESETAEG